MSATGKIAKPILRGYVKAYIVRSFLISCGVGISAGYAYKHFVADPRKKAYSDFYKNYNADEVADRMYKMGVIRGWKDNEDVPEESFKLPL